MAQLELFAGSGSAHIAAGPAFLGIEAETQRRAESHKKASKGSSCSSGAEPLIAARLTRLYLKESYLGGLHTLHKEGTLAIFSLGWGNNMFCYCCIFSR